MSTETSNLSGAEDVKIIEVEEYQTSLKNTISPNTPNVAHRIQNDMRKELVNEENERKRNEGLEIIREENDQSEEEKQEKYQNSWQYIISVILVSCGTFLVMTVVPTHDLIRYPEYWWEIMVQWCFGNKLMKLIFYSLICKAVLSYPNISSPRSMLKLFIISSASTIIYCCVVHLIWTTYLGYYEPLVLNGWWESVISQIVLMASVWFQFPTTWLTDPSNRRQRKSFIYYWLYEFSLNYQIFVFLFFIFPRIPNAFKPYGCLIFFILFREVNGFAMSTLVKKAASSDHSGKSKENADAIMNIQLACRYHQTVLMLCTQFSSDIFTYCLVAADFIFIMGMITRIIRLKRKINPTSHQTTKARELIVELVLSELIELVMPLLLMSTFTLTYYGPNAYHMEGMRGGYWQQRPVNDLWAFFFPTSFMIIGFDLILLIGTTATLYFGCNVDMIQESKKAFVKYGLLCTLNLILNWNQVRFNLITIMLRLSLRKTFNEMSFIF